MYITVRVWPVKTGWSERIREVADREYVRPAKSHRSSIKIRFGDLQKKMQECGFPLQHANQVASAIETPKFWEPRGLEMCTPRGLPRRVDSVFEFKFVPSPVHNMAAEHDPLLELAGILNGAICEGVDAFVRNIRVDKENAA